MQGRELRVYRLIEPSVSAFGYELLGVQMLRDGHNSTLRIYIDKQEGITVDDCVRVSNHVSGVLDVEDPIPGKYSLEVSSPGINRPLFTEEHYEKHQGSPIKVRLHVPFEGRRKLKGILLGLRETRVAIKDGTEKVWEVPLDLIAQARLDSAE